MIRSFETSIASKYGVNEAILVHNLYFWINKNATNGEHYHDGRYWTYNTIQALSAQSLCLTEDQVRRSVNKLLDANFLVKCNYSKSNLNRTLWYAFSDEAIGLLSESGYYMGDIAPDLCKSPNRIGQIAKSHNTDNNITDNKEYDKEKNFSLSKKWKVDFSIVPDNLTSVVEEWLAYKKERRETYKPKGFKVFVKHLNEYSQGNPSVARQIIEKSMSCNYAGIFPQKDTNNLPTGMVIHGDRNELYEADKKNLW